MLWPHEATSAIHDRVTRRSERDTLFHPKPKLEMTKWTFRYRGVKVWEEVPDALKHAESLDEFKELIVHIANQCDPGGQHRQYIPTPVYV